MGYWRKTLARRLSRRHLLATTAAFGVATVASAACGGGGSSSGSQKGDSSGLLTEFKDTTSQAKAGGTWKDSISREPASFEPFIRDITSTFHVLSTYQTLIRTKATAFKNYDPEVVEPEAAKSWEYSPDRLTLTFKIQPEAKFDRRPPTNGRNVRASDVVFSWQRFSQVSSVRSELANSISPTAPIKTVEAPDEQTVVMKLAFPTTTLLSQLRNYSAATLMIVPREAEGQFDLRKDTRGSGPWWLSEYQPSVRLVYERSPTYWDPKQPFIARREQPLIPEYATGLAQFKSGGLYNWNVRSEEVIATKKDVSALQMVPTIPNGAGYYWFYGLDGDSPFKDVRVRQALQAAIDRDLFIDTFYNVSQYQGQGLPVETRWNTCVNCSWDDWWLDPRSKDFGENAKYYQHDLAQAKALLKAAGYPDGFDIDSPHVTTASYGADYPRYMQVLLGMAQEAGIRAKTVPTDYNTEWPRIRDSGGHFGGLSAGLSGPVSRTYVFAIFNTQGSLYKGFGPDSASIFKGDPYLEDLTNKLVQEFDREKAISMVRDIQKYDAKMNYSPMMPGGANGFQLAWPVLGNFGVYQGDNTAYNYYWIDPTKPPLAS